MRSTIPYGKRCKSEQPTNDDVDELLAEDFEVELSVALQGDVPQDADEDANRRDCTVPDEPLSAAGKRQRQCGKCHAAGHNSTTCTAIVSLAGVVLDAHSEARVAAARASKRRGRRGAAQTIVSPAAK